MALRIEKTTCIIVVAGALLAASGAAQDLTFPARHEHFHKGGAGTLTFTAYGVQWEETGKTHDHSRAWKYEDIERLELAPDHVGLVTYDDIRWQFGRDREYLFDNLPAGVTAQVYPLLISRLDQRFLAHVADPAVVALYETPAKLLLGRSGSSGILTIGEDRVTFDGGEHGASRTWRYSDITNVSSAGAFDLAFATLEGENRFQLKGALAGDRYNELWRRISEANGLTTYGFHIAHTH